MNTKANDVSCGADSGAIVVKVGTLGHFAMTARKWNRRSFRYGYDES